MTAVTLTRPEVMSLVFGNLESITALAEDCDSNANMETLRHNVEEIRRLASRSVELIEAYEPAPLAPGMVTHAAT